MSNFRFYNRYNNQKLKNQEEDKKLPDTDTNRKELETKLLSVASSDDEDYADVENQKIDKWFMDKLPN